MPAKIFNIQFNNNVLKKMGIEELEILSIKSIPKDMKIIIECKLNSNKCIDEINSLYKNLHKNFSGKINIEFKTNKLDNLSETDIIKIVNYSIQKLKDKSATAKACINFFKLKIVDNVINIILGSEHFISVLNDSKTNIKLLKILEEFGLFDYKLNFCIDDTFLGETNIIETVDTKKNSDEYLKKLSIEREENKKKIENKENKKEDNKYYSNRKKLFVDEIKNESIKISNLSNYSDGENITIEGKIFNYEDRLLGKTGKILIIFRIYDGSDSVTLKIFLNDGDKNPIKENLYVKVYGKLNKIDKYVNDETTIAVDKLAIIDKEEEIREDLSTEKRVELHTHTKLSEMVGVCDVEDLIKTAKKFGHSHIAITDYSVVHAFPSAYKLAKENDISAILGCEMYIVDDMTGLLEISKDEDLSSKIIDKEFVVFDLETMGLNSRKNEIIEIGAVKIKNGNIVDTFSELINPMREIPQKITEITGISNAMVRDKSNIEEILPKFYDFIKDSILVAHNASFDMGFIKRDIKKYLSIDFKPMVIDTLKMARDLYPNLKKYGLGDLNKYFGLFLENHHRALDDATATAKMFLIFLEKLDELNIYTLEDINNKIENNNKKQSIKNVVVLVENEIGLKNLYKLVSLSHIDYFGNKKARVPKSILNKNREGLIIGSSLTSHFLNQGELAEYYFRNDLEKIEQSIDFYDYIEILPKANYKEIIESDKTGTIEDYNEIEEMNKYFINLAKETNKIVVASSNVHYIEKEDDIVRSILLYGSGNVYRDYQYKINNEFYFRTTDEMLDEFSYLGEDLAKEVVIDNTNLIASKTKMIKPVPDGFYPPKIENAEETVKNMTYEKAYKIYGNPLPKIVEDRLERELKAIIGNGFSVLYLSAQKLVKKSLDNGYLVGSRGSVGSSLVAFMMGITEVNALYPHYICENSDCKYSEFTDKEGAGVDLPSKICPKCGKELKRDGYSIPFEVFMGFNGEKVPDIDLNFSGEYQSEIHRYCEELFGKENVFKAGTISTLAEKNAIGYVKKYCEDNNINISMAEIIRLGQKCQGAKKTTGQHPGGMIVLPREHSIYEFCPVQKPANDESSSSITTHYDYHVMDEQLVKLDILGHDDPTTIKLLQEYTGIDIYKIPLNDPDTMKIFSSTDTINVTEEQINSKVGTYGVPEFGTDFVRQMLVDTRPKTFAELVRISGLSHGTDVWLNNAQEFVRNGQATLSEIITVRDDIMNFLIDSGIEKSTAFKIMEFVRKGKPSKDAEKWNEYSEIMKEKNVKDWYIESCRRIKYMFPKGHAVAYVMMAMRIAYFKVHFPLAFYAAYLSRKADDFNYETMSNDTFAKKKLKELQEFAGKMDPKKKAEQNICEIIIEMYARDIKFLPIDIYKSSGTKFTIEDGKIRIPLIGVSGLGLPTINKIIKEREESKFLSIEDLKRRTQISNTVVDKLKTIEAFKDLNDTNQISLF